jgi:Protein of unknown function (DUF1573)
MKRFLMAILSAKVFILLSFVCAMAQSKGKAEFEKLSHQFGEIKEENGPVEVTFTFKNTGSEAIHVTHVQASCGCTTPEWSKEPVAPGDKGFIKAVFDPTGRPGHFDKSVTVKTDGTPEVLALKFSGDVTPRPKGPQDYYPFEIGSLRFKTAHVSFNKIYNDEKDTASTEVYNQGKTPVTLKIDQMKLPEHLSMKASANVVKPGEKITLLFEYDAAKKADWGYVFDFFIIPTDDASTPEKRMNVSASIQENFSKLDPNAPKPAVKFDKVSHDFGKVPQNDKVATTFKITNEGQTKMYIRKSKASCGCTATHPDKTELAPGESTMINVTFSTGNKAGKQKKSITIICNDPAHPETHLWIEADVQEASQGN